MASKQRRGDHEVRRLDQRPWRDPRALVGIGVIVASTVVGGMVFAAGDDTVRYWALRDDVTQNEAVSRHDLVATSAQLSDAAAERGLAVDAELPGRIEDLVWRHDIARGTLLRREDLGRADERRSVELPLAVTPGAAPHDLRRGQEVDVWVGPSDGQSSGSVVARRVLSRVRVVSAGSSATAGAGSERTIVVDVGPADLAPSVVAATAAGHVTVVRHS